MFLIKPLVVLSASSYYNLQRRVLFERMQMKKEQLKTYGFIDSQNLNLGVRSLGLIEYLEEKGKLLKVLAPTKHYSSLLRKFNNRNYIVRIDLLRGSLEQKKTGIRGRSKP